MTSGFLSKRAGRAGDIQLFLGLPPSLPGPALAGEAAAADLRDHVRRPDRLPPLQVRDGPGHAQDAVAGPRRQPQFLYRGLEARSLAPALAPIGFFRDSLMSSMLECMKKPEKSIGFLLSGLEKRSRNREELVLGCRGASRDSEISADYRFSREFSSTHGVLHF